MNKTQEIKIPHLAVKTNGGMKQEEIERHFEVLVPNLPRMAKGEIEEIIIFAEGKETDNTPYLLKKKDFEDSFGLKLRVFVASPRDIFQMVFAKRLTDVGAWFEYTITRKKRMSLLPPVEFTDRPFVNIWGGDLYHLGINQLLFEASRKRLASKVRFSFQEETEKPADVRHNILFHTELQAQMMRRPCMDGIESVLNGESSYAFEFSNHQPTLLWDRVYAMFFHAGERRIAELLKQLEE